MANIIKNKTKENPKLLFSTLSDGRQSLYLEYYIGYQKYMDEETGKEKIKHNRRKESLNLFLTPNPKAPEQKRENEETIAIANKIRFEREQEFKEDRLGYRLKKDTRINFYNYMQIVYDSYKRSNIKTAILKFKEYISIKYPLYKDILYPEQINEEMINGYVDYLHKTSKGQGARNSYVNFKFIIRKAIKDKLINENPCEYVSVRCDTKTLTKNILSIAEIELLIKNITKSTKGKTFNLNVRRGFIFSLYTGIRYCDIKDLTYSNIDYQNKILRFNQNKTKGHSGTSWVTIPLNDNLIKFIGDPKGKNDNLFKLPTNVGCARQIQTWAKSLGIDKHLSWHCARHSFAVNILNNGANIKTVSNLLGHSGIEMTQKYLHVVDDLKATAINSLPEIKLPY